MSTNVNVFLVGITGYIGGSVFTALKQAHPECTYTALVRNPAHVAAVAAAGATPVLGTFADRETIARCASEADVVVNCADADAEDLAEAVLEGLRRRRRGGTVGVLVHTSGSAVFGDGSRDGRLLEGARPYSDGNVEDIKAITAERPHGKIDVSILQASLAGDVHSYIIAPSAIHGPGTGPVGRTSAFVKLVGGLYLAAGRAVVVGEGSNVFGFVHIADVQALYLLVVDHALSFFPAAPPSSPYERYYVCNTRHVPWSVIARLFAESLHRRGKLASPEVGTVSFEEAGPFARVIASNAYTKEERGPALGWVRKGASVEETFEGDLDTFVPPA